MLLIMTCSKSLLRNNVDPLPAWQIQKSGFVISSLSPSLSLSLSLLETSKHLELEERKMKMYISCSNRGVITVVEDQTGQ